jgi:hypothetical protein
MKPLFGNRFFCDDLIDGTEVGEIGGIAAIIIPPISVATDRGDLFIDRVERLGLKGLSLFNFLIRAASATIVLADIASRGETNVLRIGNLHGHFSILREVGTSDRSRVEVNIMRVFRNLSSIIQILNM